MTVGSCATGARESGQARKGAAFNGIACAPQIAWPSPQLSGPSVFVDSASVGAQASGGNCSEASSLEVVEGLLQF